MNNREVLKSLFGGFVVYVACASGTGSQQRNEPTDAFTETGIIEDVVQLLDGLIPEAAIADAKADDAVGPQPIVIEGKCDKTYSTSAGQTFYYAEFAFPGKSKDELAKRATVTQCYSAANGLPPGYQCTTALANAAKDGAVAVLCGSNANMFSSLSVTFE